MPFDAFFLSAAVYILCAAYAQAIPSAAPPMTSVGKCTYRYSLEKAIAKAITPNTFQCLYFEKYIAPAAAKDAAVCPEGNE